MELIATADSQAATIYHALGIDLETYHTTPDGRPIKVNNEGGLIPDLV